MFSFLMKIIGYVLKGFFILFLLLTLLVVVTSLIEGDYDNIKSFIPLYTIIGIVYLFRRLSRGYKMKKQSPFETHYSSSNNYGKGHQSNNNQDNSSVTLKHDFMSDVFHLLWIADGEHKNYSFNPSTSYDSELGLSISITCSGDIEPSVISLKDPIKKPKNMLFVEALSYYPTYSSLTSEQRYVYLNWLKDINKSIDIGYVFLFYYGLERHLYTGNFQDAFNTILRLRYHHKNASFLSYSNNALLGSLLFHNREDLFEKYLDVVEDVSVSGIYLFLKHNSKLGLSAKDIILLASEAGFTNRRYIKSDYELFLKVLEDKLINEYGSSTIPLDNIDINKCDRTRVNIAANTSLKPRDISIPNVLSDTNLKLAINRLLSETHETVKQELREQRKQDKA